MRSTSAFSRIASGGAHESELPPQPRSTSPQQPSKVLSTDDEHRTAVMADLYTKLQEAQIHLREQVRTNYDLQDQLRNAQEALRVAQQAEQRARSDAQRHHAHRKAESEARAKEDRQNKRRAELAEQDATNAADTIVELREQVTHLQAELAEAERRADLAEDGMGPASRGQVRKLYWQIEQERRETRQRERAGAAVLEQERNSVAAQHREKEAKHESRKQALAMKTRALDEMTERAELEQRKTESLKRQMEELRHRNGKEATGRQQALQREQQRSEREAQQRILKERANASMQILEAERRAYAAECARRELESVSRGVTRGVTTAPAEHGRAACGPAGEPPYEDLQAYFHVDERAPPDGPGVAAPYARGSVPPGPAARGSSLVADRWDNFDPRATKAGTWASRRGGDKVHQHL